NCVDLFFFLFKLHSFICRLEETLFMWPILYFLILFISYCCVQYYSSSIYRYILVKRNMFNLILFSFIFQLLGLKKNPNLGTFIQL
uniref:Uncharacterized protein n=1 Tax=Nothobranchius furzeri TaxID=105023 RepID=A0A8C6LSF2_NOTFU